MTIKIEDNIDDLTAVKNVAEVIRGAMTDCEIVSIAETQIMDVFEYHPKEENK